MAETKVTTIFTSKSGGYMAQSEWVEDKGAFYYLDQNGKMKEMLG